MPEDSLLASYQYILLFTVFLTAYLDCQALYVIILMKDSVTTFFFLQ